MDYALLTAVEEAKTLIAGAAREKYAKTVENAVVSSSRDQAQADLASPACFSLAKQMGKNPADLAGELAAEINAQLNGQPARENGPAGGYLERAEASNGYLNFFFSPKFFDDCLKQVAPGYGAWAFGNGRKAVVDFSSPNVGKPMHIGHIRSTILGDSVRKLLQKCGFEVVGENYLCEAGNQVATLMLGIREFGPENLNDDKDLLDYYVKISKKVEETPELKQKALEIVNKMENGDKSIAEQLQRVRTLSLPPLYRNYKTLGIEFESEVYDSDVVEKGKKMVAEAVEKKVAFKDEKGGEIVGALEEKTKLPNLVILRSNGTTLYSTRDLGLAEERWNKYAFDACIYVTASEQNTHFRQVFKLLELMGRGYSAKMEHIGFGLIFMEGGQKLSTRKGQVLLLEDVLNSAVEKAGEEIGRQGYSDEEKKTIAEQVGIAAVKFAVLRVTSQKDIHFSPEKSVSFEGDTGAYVQYTFVRSKKILEKAAAEGALGATAGGAGGKYAYLPEERLVAKTIAEFPSVVKNAAESRQPNQVCDYLLRLCAAFSSFYTNCPVLKADSAQAREKRLEIVKATNLTLSEGLGLLGMKTPEKM